MRRTALLAIVLILLTWGKVHQEALGQVANVDPVQLHESKIAKLIAALDEGQHSVRISAMKKLGDYGTAASPAVPALGKMLRGPYKDLGDQAASSLAQIGKAAAKELVASLSNSSAIVTERALRAAHLLGPEAASAADAVCGLLQHDERKIRALAVQALGEMGPVAQPIAPRLAQALRDREPEVRLLAGAALREIGVANVMHVLPLLSDENADYRLNAVQLLPLFHERPESVRALVECLRANEAKNRRAAAASLIGLGPSARPAMFELLKALKDGDPQLQKAAFQALMAIGMVHNDCLLDALARISEDTEPRWPFLQDPKGRNPVTSAARSLQDGSDMVRLGAVLALANLKTGAKPALPALRKVLKDQNTPLVRAAALLAIASIDRGRKQNYDQARAFLSEFMRDLKADGYVNTEDLVHLHVFAWGIPQLNADDNEAKQFMATLAAARVWSRESLRDLPYGSGRVPVIVRALNLAARFQLGFAEPFASLSFKLEVLTQESRNLKELVYAVSQLGSETSRNSPFWATLQQTRYRILATEFVLENLILKQQELFAKSLMHLNALELEALLTHARGQCTEWKIQKSKSAADREHLSLQLVLTLKTRKLVAEFWKLDVPGLHEKLRHPDPLARWSAVNIIGRKRIHAEEALIALLGDPTREVRDAARKALIRLGRGTDFGPHAPNSAAKTQLAMQRWREWLSMQEPVSAGGSQRPTTKPPSHDLFDPPKRIIKKNRD